MSARLLDGRALAGRLAARLRPRAAALARRLGRPPALAVVTAGAGPVARVHLAQILKACYGIGLAARVRMLPRGSSQGALERILSRLGRDAAVDAALVQTPLPRGLRLAQALERLPPAKDAEGLHPANFGRLFQAKDLREIRAAGLPVPPTAAALLELLFASGAPTRGRLAAVIGRSSVVGRPVAQLLSCVDATVLSCHSRTRGLRSLLRRSDIVVCAAGRPGLLRGMHVKPGAVVLDAGSTWVGGKLLGDADFGSVRRAAGWLTPVPGGVGPLAAVLLLRNVLLLCSAGAHGRRRAQSVL